MLESKKYLQLQNINAYVISFQLSTLVWNIVLKWNYFNKTTVGTQYVRAADSISANIAEGFGRFSKKDKINFYRYSYGSVYESKDWTEKAKTRKLLTPSEYIQIASLLNKIPLEIHGLIRFTNQKLAI
ncbi:MAG: four helix bundle protein [Patescibacteria group bacterium]